VSALPAVCYKYRKKEEIKKILIYEKQMLLKWIMGMKIVLSV
jgi:hypothetical protein